MMTVRILYAPMNDVMKKGKTHDLYARFKFNIFKELQEEFSTADYPTENDIPL